MGLRRRRDDWKVAGGLKQEGARLLDLSDRITFTPALALTVHEIGWGMQMLADVINFREPKTSWTHGEDPKIDPKLLDEV